MSFDMINLFSNICHLKQRPQDFKFHGNLFGSSLLSDHANTPKPIFDLYDDYV